ncbi:MAG: 16S rRNA (guanine(966)-N(2))-methyltransferase RsmD [Pyrinomonadaceae bacterium]
MDNRRKSSPNYPKSPHRKTKFNTGEQKEGYRKGPYSRDKNSEDKQGFRGKSRGPKPFGKRQDRGGGTRDARRDLPPITSDDQVTDGKYRGRKILVSESPKLKPTDRRLREVFFRILYRKIRAKRFLDICAGSGTVGIDAISRGALIATMVERKIKNCALIRENLKTLGISEGHGEVIEAEVVPFLKSVMKRRRFWDVVYFAPPYDYEYEEAMELFRRGASIRPGGIFVIEHHAEMFFPENIGVLKRWKVVVEGDSAMSFYDRRN